MTKPSQPVELLTYDEAMRVVEAFYRRGATAARNRAMLALMWRCGLRSAEVCRLKLWDIDADSPVVHIQSVNGDASRSVCIDTWGREIVGQWLLERSRMHRVTSYKLFCTSKGGSVSGQYLRRAFCEAGEWAGIGKRVYPQLFRHMFASKARLVWINE